MDFTNYCCICLLSYQGDHSVLGFKIQGFQGESRRFLPIFQGEFVIYGQNKRKNQGVFKEISDLLTTFTSKINQNHTFKL